MRYSLALAILGLGCAVSAQIPLPPYSSTFSANATRGFFFQTPVPIVITGLRVPNEQRHALQNVEVYKMTVAPPAYPATGTGGQVFYAVGRPSGTVIPCALPFAAGDYVGVLGACGDATIMHNSYGSTAPASNVLGNPITLNRFLTQFNLVSSGGNQPYSSEVGAIARIEVFVAGQSSAIDFGTGAGIGTQPAPTLTTTAMPVVGQTGTLSLNQSYAPNQGGILAMGFGRAQIPIFQGTLWVNPGVLFLTTLPTLSSGANPINLPIPAAKELIGAGPIDFQGFVLVLPNLAMTNGTEWFLGY